MTWAWLCVFVCVSAVWTSIYTLKTPKTMSLLKRRILLIPICWCVSLSLPYSFLPMHAYFLFHHCIFVDRSVFYSNKSDNFFLFWKRKRRDKTLPFFIKFIHANFDDVKLKMIFIWFIFTLNANSFCFESEKKKTVNKIEEYKNHSIKSK